MATNSTLLCIHRDLAQLTLLEENGYELVTATRGSDGLRLLMSRPADGIVLEYHLGLLNSSVVAAEIKKVKPQLPIVMLADPPELPPERSPPLMLWQPSPTGLTCFGQPSTSF